MIILFQQIGWATKIIALVNTSCTHLASWAYLLKPFSTWQILRGLRPLKVLRM